MNYTLSKAFKNKAASKLSSCSPFELSKEESDMLFGGVREYHPPIYETEKQEEKKIQTNELLIDISQPNKNL